MLLPPLYHSAIASLIGTGPSAQSRGPPHPLVVKKAQCHGRGGGGRITAGGERMTTTNNNKEVSGQQICKGFRQRMEVCSESLAQIFGCKPVPLPIALTLAPFPILPVQPWTAASPLYLD